MSDDKKEIKNRGLKTRTAFSNAVKTELYDAFKRYSVESKVNISKMLDEAIEDYLKKHNIKY